MIVKSLKTVRLEIYIERDRLNTKVFFALWAVYNFGALNASPGPHHFCFSLSPRLERSFTWCLTRLCRKTISTRRRHEAKASRLWIGRLTFHPASVLHFSPHIAKEAFVEGLVAVFTCTQRVWIGIDP